MAVPNLVALLALSPVVVRLTREQLHGVLERG
jgi:Na+/alanine symporter